MLIGTAALANSSLPTVLVATKCDTPDDLRHPDLSGLASAFPTCAGHFRTASNAPATVRECLQAMLRVALANRRGEIYVPPALHPCPTCACAAASHHQSGHGLAYHGLGTGNTL